MSPLLEFLQTHEEAFRSRARLASLYSDFHHQKSSNPDGYAANATAWLHALSAATRAGLIPSPTGQNDHFVLHCREELSRALQTAEHGRPLALEAAIQEGVRRRELVQVKVFLERRESIYGGGWIPTPWEIVQWGLRRLGVLGEKADGVDFVALGNVEAAAKAVLDEASKIATSNTSRIFTQEMFASTFAPAVGLESMSPTDLKVLLTYLSRDRSALSFSSTDNTIKFKPPAEAQPAAITKEDVSIAKLRSLISSMEPQIQRLTNKVADLDQKAREAVANKQLTNAKSLLRSKKLSDTQLQQRSATLASLEEVYAKIEQAADQVEIVQVMEESSKTLKSLNQQTGGVEKVQDVMDGLRDEMMTADEIGNTINEVTAGEIDEGEVDDELEALEKVEREKIEKAEGEERERREEAARKEREQKDEEEAEKTRLKLAELDRMVDAGTPVPQDSDVKEGEGERQSEYVGANVQESTT